MSFTNSLPVNDEFFTGKEFVFTFEGKDHTAGYERILSNFDNISVTLSVGTPICPCGTAYRRDWYFIAEQPSYCARVSRCASYCAPCQPLLRVFSGWIRSPPPTPSPTVGFIEFIEFPYRRVYGVSNSGLLKKK